MLIEGRDLSSLSGHRGSADSLRSVPKLPWLLRATRVQLAGATAVFAVAVFAIAFIADWLAFQAGHSLMRFVVSNIVTAVLTSALALTLVSRASERRRVVHERLRILAELNHHIRNALEVIQMSAHTTKDKQAIATINEAADRIQVALREILGDAPTPRIR